MLFNVQEFGGFLVIFLLLDSSLFPHGQVTYTVCFQSLEIYWDFLYDLYMVSFYF